MAENTVKNEKNLNSQSSQLEKEDLPKLFCASKHQNQTSWGLKKFTQWLEKQKISCDLHPVSPELKGILRNIFAEVKTNKPIEDSNAETSVYLYRH